MFNSLSKNQNFKSKLKTPAKERKSSNPIPRNSKSTPKFKASSKMKGRGTPTNFKSNYKANQNLSPARLLHHQHSSACSPSHHQLSNVRPKKQTNKQPKFSLTAPFKVKKISEHFCATTTQCASAELSGETTGGAAEFNLKKVKSTQKTFPL